MLKSIKLTNLLSFGAETEITFNKGLNVLIGANGSGKSNLIEAISLLQAMPMPKSFYKVVSNGGGAEEWLWKGEKLPIAELEVVIHFQNKLLHHFLNFEAMEYRLNFLTELVYYDEDEEGWEPRIYDDLRDPEDIYPVFESALTHFSPPQELFNLGDLYKGIRIYREWHFGRNNLTRNPQRADLPNDFLEEDGSNLGLILSSFRRNSEVKRKLLESLKLFYENIEDFEVIVQGGYVQIFFEENGFTIPATRLSDGTLRYLSLLAILLHPNPPPLICIEEPELGLHPDILPTLIDLLKEAAQKTQVIITTHSADLIDDLTDTPESVLVFDKYQGSTTVKSLKQKDLQEWLTDYKDYKLGQLWRSGEFGGNRW
jgi:predicted ATPase